jgi:hypothetical protein
VPLDECGQRRRQRVEVEPAAQADRERGRVLGAARLELVQEPQPLLREGQRVVGAVRHDRDRRRDGATDLAGELRDRGVGEQRAG